MRKRWPRAQGLLTLLVFWCGSAYAHDAFGSGKSVIAGALHLVASPLAVAAVLGLVLALMGIGESWALKCAGIAGAGTAAACALPGHFPAFAAPAAVVLVGLSAAANLKPMGPLAVLLALVAGLAGGIAADLDTPTWQGIVGAAGTTMLITACALAGLEDLIVWPKLRSAIPIARRVAGSWIAAIGLLLGALAIRSGAA